MRFKVLGPNKPVPPNTPNQFFLKQDNWNDYHFRTQYLLYYKNKNLDEIFIGYVKILKQGQEKNTGAIIQKDFNELGDDYCSVGQNIDYYTRLAALDHEIPDTCRSTLEALRDFALYPDLKKKFLSEPAWQASLFRDFRDTDGFLGLARILIEGDYRALAADDMEFTFSIPHWDTPLELDFRAPTVPKAKNKPRLDVQLPGRIAVLIGRNGSGKSTLLARIARVAFASGKMRNKLKAIGTIEPEGIAFPRVITISYSAFDSFEIPGSRIKDRMQIADDVGKGEGRFVFCGLRDIARELKDEIHSQDDVDNAEQILEKDERKSTTHLKSISQLAQEFEDTLKIIKFNGESVLFNDALSIIATDTSFNDIRSEMNFESFISEGIKEKFSRWSTGHKIVLQIIASLSAYSTPKALILFDEPESHLHPPLLAALMHAIRLILDYHSAFAIIATHSPVILQEALARQVKVIRRESDTTIIRTPSIETFGENIGIITSEIFGLNSQVTDFHRVLQELTYSLGSTEKVGEVLGALSMQARAYVMSLLPEDDEDQDE